MENWIGVGVWILMGAGVALALKAAIPRPEADGRAETLILVALGVFGAVVGGMLGVGIFHFFQPRALSPGGTASAAVLAAVMAGLYRWGIRGLV